QPRGGHALPAVIHRMERKPPLPGDVVHTLTGHAPPSPTSMATRARAGRSTPAYPELNSTQATRARAGRRRMGARPRGTGNDCSGETPPTGASRPLPVPPGADAHARPRP